MGDVEFCESDVQAQNAKAGSGNNPARPHERESSNVCLHKAKS